MHACTYTHTHTHRRKKGQESDFNCSTERRGSFQSVFKRRESVTVSDVIRQVIPGVGAIVGETAETMLLSFVAVSGKKTCIR